jgi:hypothetical protein
MGAKRNSSQALGWHDFKAPLFEEQFKNNLFD